jgi:hypothetical protein
MPRGAPTSSRLSAEKGDHALPENDAPNLSPKQIRTLGKRPKLVREMSE